MLLKHGSHPATQSIRNAIRLNELTDQGEIILSSGLQQATQLVIAFGVLQPIYDFPDACFD
jgi:hypothetical protein